jgi:hypothetical protein
LLWLRRAEGKGFSPLVPFCSKIFKNFVIMATSLRQCGNVFSSENIVGFGLAFPKSLKVLISSLFVDDGLVL